MALIDAANANCAACTDSLTATVLAGPRGVVTTLAGYVYWELNHPQPGWKYTLVTDDAHRAAANGYYNEAERALKRMGTASRACALEHAVSFFTAKVPADVVAALRTMFARLTA